MIGEKFNCNDGSVCIVTEYIDSRNIKVIFEGFECKGFDGVFVQKFHLLNGKVKNRLRKSVYGFGIIGYGDYNTAGVHGQDPAYIAWKSMIRRCYHVKSKSYKYYGGVGVYVDESWAYYQNFAKWFYSQKPKYNEKYNVDKDVLKKSKKIYKEEFCILMPGGVNQIFNTQKSRRNTLPIGVASIPNKKTPFRAHMSLLGQQIVIGAYKTSKDAFFGYKEKKEAYIVKTANTLFKNKTITKRAFNAMVNYRVDIDD